MNDLLKKDIVVKIISIVFALFLWYNVVDRNANPVETKIMSIPVTILNKDTLSAKKIGLKSNTVPNVLLTVKGKKNKVKNADKNDFVVKVDLSNVNTITDYELAVDSESLITDISIENVEPRTVKLNLEKITQSSFKVDVMLKGTLKKNYKIIETKVYPEVVSVENYDSVIKSISSVTAVVDSSNLDNSIELEKECRFYNDKNEDITNLINKNIKVNVKIDVAKEVQLVTDVKGQPAQGFLLVDYNIIPEKQLIRGTKDLLASTFDIRSEPVNIKNLKTTSILKSKLLLPSGISTVNGADETDVKVIIEKEGLKEITLSKEDISVIYPTNLPTQYDILTSSVKISLIGKNSDLENININNLKPSINIDSLTQNSIGTYRLPLNLSLPVNIRPAENYEVEIQIQPNEEQILVP